MVLGNRAATMTSRRMRLTRRFPTRKVKSTLLGNTDYGVIDKVARNLEKETNEGMYVGANFACKKRIQ